MMVEGAKGAKGAKGADGPDGAAAASWAASKTTTEPSATLSPILTLISAIVPADELGISMDALSLSTVIRL